jgi:hypothetical protein
MRSKISCSLLLALALALAACNRPRVRDVAPAATATPDASPIATSTPVSNELPASCTAPVDVVLWETQLWMILGHELALSPNPCARYYVSLPPVPCAPGETLKLCPRGGNAAQAIRDLGPQFHAMAEFHWGSWSQYVAQTGMSWHDAGVEFRRRMGDAGYDVDSGDLWEINEFPSSVRTGIGPARANTENAVRGLDAGEPGSTPVKGTVFIIGMGHGTTNLSVYKPAVERWLKDTTFWTSMNAHVRFFAQEVYADPKKTCVPGSTVATRSHRVNEFVEHLGSLAAVAPGTAGTARSYLKHAYVPLMNAAWGQEPRVGLGDTRVPLVAMKKFVSLELYATRAWGATHAVPGRRVGFAWAPRNSLGQSDAGYKASLDELALRMAQGIRDGYDPDTGSAARACSPSGSAGECACSVNGAAFNPAWAGFSSY